MGARRDVGCPGSLCLAAGNLCDIPGSVEGLGCLLGPAGLLLDDDLDPGQIGTDRGDVALAPGECSLGGADLVPARHRVLVGPRRRRPRQHQQGRGEPEHRGEGASTVGARGGPGDELEGAHGAPGDVSDRGESGRRGEHHETQQSHKKPCVTELRKRYGVSA